MQTRGNIFQTPRKRNLMQEGYSLCSAACVALLQGAQEITFGSKRGILPIPLSPCTKLAALKMGSPRNVLFSPTATGICKQ